MSTEYTTSEARPKTTLFHRGLAAAGERPEDWVDGFGQVRRPATGIRFVPDDWLEIEQDMALRRIRRGLWSCDHPVNGCALFQALEDHCLRIRSAA